jgi:hypothetical protein
MRIKESIATGQALDLGNNPRYRRIGPGAPTSPTFSAQPVRSAPPHDPDPPLSQHLQCPMPGVTVATDSLRQFYRHGIPQMRLLPPKPL